MMQSTSRRVLVTGSRGQLGRCLQFTLPDDVDLRVTFSTSEDFNLTDVQSMRIVLDELRPDYIVNCAAYTDVDGAEDNPDQASAVNHFALIDLAGLCAERKIKLLHISTDFVFDGKARKPYPPEHECSPVSQYGRTKALGERAVAQALPEDSMIIRTSWLYSEFGSNFVKTMLKLYENQDSFRVVHNQKGSPTYAIGLAKLIWHILGTRQFSPGVFHWCDKGEVSWYDFAVEIGNRATNKGIISKSGVAMPILSSEYGAKAVRPNYSCLYCYPTLKKYPKMRQLPWRDRLDQMLDAYLAGLRTS